MLTRKKERKPKPKSTPLPKAKQNYLEAEATLKEELTDLAIGFESKFQPIHTKHWRFDFHIVKLRLLIEIEGAPGQVDVAASWPIKLGVLIDTIRLKSWDIRLSAFIQILFCWDMSLTG